MELIKKEELSIVESKIDAMKQAVGSIEIKSKDDLSLVATNISNVKKMRKFVEQERDKYIKPAKDIIENAKTAFGPYLEVCDDVEKILKDKAQVFMIEDKKREDEAKAKEVAKVESGYQKPETAVKKIEQIEKADTKVKTDAGTLSMKMVKEVVIVDQSLIPEEYYKPRELDMVKIKKVATAGIAIPGVKVEEKPQMASRGI